MISASNNTRSWPQLCNNTRPWPELCNNIRSWHQLCNKARSWAQLCNNTRSWPQLCNNMRSWPKLCNNTRSWPQLYNNTRSWAQLCNNTRSWPQLCTPSGFSMLDILHRKNDRCIYKVNFTGGFNVTVVVYDTCIWNRTLDAVCTAAILPTCTLYCTDLSSGFVSV